MITFTLLSRVVILPVFLPLFFWLNCFLHVSVISAYHIYHVLSKINDKQMCVVKGNKDWAEINELF